jgi:hypothetical protein
VALLLVEIILRGLCLDAHSTAFFTLTGRLIFELNQHLLAVPVFQDFLGFGFITMQLLLNKSAPNIL